MVCVCTLLGGMLVTSHTAKVKVVFSAQGHALRAKASRVPARYHTYGGWDFTSNARDFSIDKRCTYIHVSSQVCLNSGVTPCEKAGRETIATLERIFSTLHYAYTTETSKNSRVWLCSRKVEENGYDMSIFKPRERKRTYDMYSHIYCSLEALEPQDYFCVATRIGCLNHLLISPPPALLPETETVHDTYARHAVHALLTHTLVWQLETRHKHSTGGYICTCTFAMALASIFDKSSPREHNRRVELCRCFRVWPPRLYPLRPFGLLLPKKRLSSKAVVAERMRVALAVIAHVQVVVEKLARQHGGPRRRRQAITYLETLKALSRLLLLACTREMVIGGGAVRIICFAFSLVLR